MGDPEQSGKFKNWAPAQANFEDFDVLGGLRCKFFAFLVGLKNLTRMSQTHQEHVRIVSGHVFDDPGSILRDFETFENFRKF